MIKAAFFLPAMLAGLVLAGSAFAQASSLDSFRTAVISVRAKVAQAEASGQAPPTLADPASAPQIRAAFDPAVPSLVGGTDVQGLLDTCGAATDLGKAYLLFGVKAKLAALPKDAEPAEAQVTLVNENSARFQDEVALATRFNIACYGATLPAVARYAQGIGPADRTAARKEALLKIRRHASDAYKGVVVSQLDPIRAANRQAPRDVGLTQLDAYAQAMSPPERQGVIQVIDQVLAASTTLDPAVRDKLGKLKAGLGRTDCTGFCNLWAEPPAGG